ncbi:Sec14p-like phosphatidylinositol transfer family protein [Prunus dulcis]|uniref:Sec14p-like phosphatidylinositol transfer family protein n=1 Tax=Prunus dulcis TaxID=3755 RepID=A0A4Y1QS06_PRUDU|nr:Sec14p-like phosphatidylinositol transfer family protein [Prunus dulcis]
MGAVILLSLLEFQWPTPIAKCSNLKYQFYLILILWVYLRVVWEDSGVFLEIVKFKLKLSPLLRFVLASRGVLSRKSVSSTQILQQTDTQHKVPPGTSFKASLSQIKFEALIDQKTKKISYPEVQMEKNQEIALTEMRKSVQKLGTSTEKYGDPTLMRFLIARSMDPDKAAKMFVQWHKWRASFVPNAFISDSEGLSKDGYPLMIVKASKHFPSKDHLQFKKFVVHLLDKTIARGREIGNEKLIGILDLQQISYKNVDARGLITGFQFLQSYYPERLAKCFILNMPWFFVSVWRMVSRFLEKATAEKIVIVSNEDETKNFIKEVGEETLPEEYGGRAKLVPLQDVVLAPMED